MAVSISVIIPAYNSAAYIEAALQSALEQTYPPSEIIVIDDGSADDTAAKAGSYPVRVLRQRNGGPAAARNAGIREATGEWIAFLDADDSWIPEKLERQVGHLGDPALGIVSSSARWQSGLVSTEQLWEGNRVLTSCCLARRRAIVEAGYFDEDPGLISLEDYNLWLRIAAKGWSIKTVREDLCHYSPAAGSLSSQTERMADAEMVNIVKIAALFGYPSGVVNRKRAAVCAAYGTDALYMRNKSLGRKLFVRSLKSRFSATALVYFISCCLPNFVLNARRTLGAG
jgi:glycosyltransferase involved in cell wall biosynthesis